MYAEGRQKQGFASHFFVALFFPGIFLPALPTSIRSLFKWNHLVFHNNYRERDNPRINDDEYWEDIYFELPMDTDHFFFENEDMKEIDLYLRPSCFCVNLDPILIS